jgi:hypothetical protein
MDGPGILRYSSVAGTCQLGGTSNWIVKNTVFAAMAAALSLAVDCATGQTCSDVRF